jgi:hypothetical protein
MRTEKQRPVGSVGGGCIEASGRKVEGGMDRQEAGRWVGMVVGGQNKEADRGSWAGKK